MARDANAGQSEEPVQDCFGDPRAARPLHAPMVKITSAFFQPSFLIPGRFAAIS